VLINVGSSSSNPNGRGRIFKDLTFEYLPIPEDQEISEKVPTYRELGFTEVRFPNLPVHLDPEFGTFTYGHVRRGFGDIQSLLRLKESRNGVLFFYATLQIDDGWAPYAIGFFKNLQIYDCRVLSKEEMMSFKAKGFSDNSHIKRIDPSVDFLIKGGEGSKPLKKAFPLAEDHDHKALRKSLENTILTPTGKKVKPGTPWFRWTLICPNCEDLLLRVSKLVN
jgi:hypothetical protein